jgi:hypothetical protein
MKELRRHKAELQAAADAEAAGLDGLRARADQQQAWRLASDRRERMANIHPSQRDSFATHATILRRIGSCSEQY